jgi:hypothetical protein
MKRVLIGMHQFQKENEITKECITNVQYFYDIMNTEGLCVKAKPVFAIYSIINEMQYDTIVVIHMVIELKNGGIIDPSYEISSIDDCQYCDNTKTLIKTLSTYPSPLSKEYITSAITKFLKFKNLADDINANKFIICDKEFYHNQHDYITTLFSAMPLI